MQIVINISKEEYKRVMDGKWEGNALADYIENGKPIQEGHGDLIDKNTLLTTTDIRADGSEFTYVPYHEIEDTPIIIEAESEVQNDKENM